MNASCSGCVTPSIVVTSLPSKETARARQALIRLPSVSTVQAPQAPWSQPFLGPVTPSRSRSRSSRLTQGSTSTVSTEPFTFSCISIPRLLSSQQQR